MEAIRSGSRLELSHGLRHLVHGRYRFPNILHGLTGAFVQIIVTLRQPHRRF